MRSLYFKHYIARFLFLETYEPEEHLHYLLIEEKSFTPPPVSQPSPSRAVEIAANQEEYSDEDSDIRLVSTSKIVYLQ